MNYLVHKYLIWKKAIGNEAVAVEIIYMDTSIQLDNLATRYSHF